MQWSRMLQESGIPYNEWTVGASTALDHWIARNILQLSEATWQSLLEGNDPSCLSRGQDIVAVRETLFPETKLELSENEMLQAQEQQAQLEAEEQASKELSSDEPASVDELLKTLRGFDGAASEERSFGKDTWDW